MVHGAGCFQVESWGTTEGALCVWDNLQNTRSQSWGATLVPQSLCWFQIARWDVRPCPRITRWVYDHVHKALGPSLSAPGPWEASGYQTYPQIRDQCLLTCPSLSIPLGTCWRWTYTQGRLPCLHFLSGATLLRPTCEGPSLQMVLLGGWTGHVPLLQW